MAGWLAFKDALKKRRCPLRLFLCLKPRLIDSEMAPKKAVSPTAAPHSGKQKQQPHSATATKKAAPPAAAPAAAKNAAEQPQQKSSKLKLPLPT
jgi:hypothetical protein